MSRVDKMPIATPTGVAVAIAPRSIVMAKGPKGELIKAMYKDINIAVEDAQVVVIRPSDVKEHRALHGLIRVLLNSMVVGVSQGFSKTLELNGAGYRAQLQGEELVMNLGYSYPVEVEVTDGIGFRLDGTTKAIVEGIDKEKVGAVAANARSQRKPEPYKGKGIRCSSKVIRRKEGKTGR